MYLGACDSSLGAVSVRHGHRASKPVPNEKKRVVYRFHGGPSLSGYEDEMGLGKFKLKNVVKSVTKAAAQVAKVAVTPAALVAASSLDAVGLRHAASKVVDATALNKNLAKTEKQVAKVAGTGIDVAAAGLVAAAAAPAIGTAAGSIGATAAKGAVFAKTLLPKAAGLVGGIFSKKKGGTAPTEDSGVLDTTASIVKDVAQAAESASPVLKKAMTFRKSAAVPGESDAAPESQGASPEQSTDSAAQAPSGTMPTFSGGGGGGGSAPGDAVASDQPAQDAAKPEPSKVSPWLFLVPALFLL